jgi:hypothetical protein
VGERIDEVLAVPSLRDDLMLALVHLRPDDAGLDELGAGIVDQLWHEGDEDLLWRLRHHGVSPAAVARMDAAISR